MTQTPNERRTARNMFTRSAFGDFTHEDGGEEFTVNSEKARYLSKDGVTLLIAHENSGLLTLTGEYGRLSDDDKARLAPLIKDLENRLFYSTCHSTPSTSH